MKNGVCVAALSGAVCLVVLVAAGCHPPVVAPPEQPAVVDNTVLAFNQHQATSLVGEEVVIGLTGPATGGIVAMTSGNPPKEDRQFAEAPVLIPVDHPVFGRCAHVGWWFWPLGNPYPTSNISFAVSPGGWAMDLTNGYIGWLIGDAFYPYRVDGDTRASLVPIGPRAISRAVSFIGTVPGIYYLLVAMDNGSQVAQTVITVLPLTPSPTSQIILIGPGGGQIGVSSVIVIGPAGVGLAILGGTPPFTVVVSGPVTFQMIGATTIWLMPVANTPPGTYTVTIQVTDGQGRTVAFVFTVQITQPPTASAGAVVVVSENPKGVR